MYIDEMKTHHMTLALGVLCLILQMGEKITLATRNLFYILIMSIYLHSILTYMVYPNKLGWLDCYRIRKNICRSRVMNADINMSREKTLIFAVATISVGWRFSDQCYVMISVRTAI
jgi:hypothetical protein